ncbi:hypothetical protein CPT_Shemara_063 [Salmonella phage Shemara]|uniref:Uncharacterized protein n=1 Tax=Salmonella phage Shemara TaxID=2596714 RepID=A0A5B8RQW5_9CAUD|nr:hypothetical protein PF624_gp63 [Salmonella phage Shemara]QEA10392.1 hypothetical protein CPT_Shemara_063 [Salmonella phage Shemara]
MKYSVKFYDGSEMRVATWVEGFALFTERADAYDIVELEAE